MKKIFASILRSNLTLLSLVLFLTACGGSGSNAGFSGNTAISRIGSGLGGTGTGEITAFGSIFINGTRKFELNNDTQIFLDDVPISETELRQQGLGLFVHIYVATDVSDDITTGTALRVFARTQFKGSVTSTTPLQIFDQTIEITGDTVLVNTTGQDLSVGDMIEVSGYLGANNTIQATRVAYKANGVSTWRLTGTLSSVTATQLSIGSQVVNLGNITPKECSNGLQAGVRVEITLTPDRTFRAGEPLTTVTGIECDEDTLYIPDDIPASILPANFEGIVSTVNTSPITRIMVSDQPIIITPTTTFIGGTVADIIVGVRLEAEGTVDTSTSTREIMANKIRFRQSRVRIEAPLNVPIGGLAATFDIMDVISVTTNSSTRNEINNTNNGLQPNGLKQVEIRGFVDKTGRVFAERIRNRGNADSNDTRLRGPLANPSNAASRFSILGITIDASSAQSIKNKEGNNISLDQFFSQVTTGTVIQVNNGTFSSNPPTIRNGEIEIEN